MQEVAQDARQNKPFVAMEKERAQSRRETTPAERDRHHQELESMLEASQAQ